MRLTTFALVSILFLGCDYASDNDQANQLDYRGRAVERLEPVGIVLGHSIHGIQIDDTQEEVIDKLGPPDGGGQGLFGDGGPPTVWIYDSVNMQVRIGETVVSIFLPPNFEGTTAQGNGIGSELQALVAEWGPPDSIDVRGNETNHFYFQDETRFLAQYESDLLLAVYFQKLLPY